MPNSWKLQWPNLGISISERLPCRRSRMQIAQPGQRCLSCYMIQNGASMNVPNEIAFCRQVFHTSLAPRPKPMNQPKPENPKRRPELPKPLPKKPKSDATPADAPKPKPATPKGAQWDPTWVRRMPDGKGICMRFNLNKCKSGKTCRFAHVCPVPKANGEPCAGSHTAARHKSAPH